MTINPPRQRKERPRCRKCGAECSSFKSQKDGYCARCWPEVKRLRKTGVKA